jgi:hypothetical protein
MSSRGVPNAAEENVTGDNAANDIGPVDSIEV